MSRMKTWVRGVLVATLGVGGIGAVAHALPAAGEPLIITGSANAVTYLTVKDAQTKVNPQGRAKLNGGTARLIWDGDTRKLKVGDYLRPVTLATAPVGMDGKFSLHHAPGAAELATMRGNNGWLNVTVEITSRLGTKGSLGTSRRWSGSSWSDPKRPDKDPSQAIAVNVAVDTRGLAPGSPAGATRTAAAYPCLFRLKGHAARSTRIALLHNGSNAVASWRYGRTADSDIEGGIKFWATGAQAIDATYSVNDSHSTDVFGTVGTLFNQYVRTDFDYQLFRREHGNLPYGTPCDESGSLRVGDVFERPNYWAAGATYDAGTGSENLSCRDSRVKGNVTYYKQGTGYHTNESRATKIGYAVNTGFLRLGQTSGYSEFVDLGWTVKQGGRGLYLCGKNPGYVFQSPGIVYAWNAPV